jgi:hypothetical protein
VARTANPVPTYRVTLDLPEPVRKQLDTLRDRTQAATLVEVVRRALAVYSYLWDEKASCVKLMLRDEAGREKELVLL